ncbi:MAG: hypothetical protein ACREEE_16320 [Dongiaceae bacterium]
MGRWIWCGLAGLFAIIALFVSAAGGAHSPVAYYGGLGFFVFCLLFIMFHVKQSFDREGNKH